MHAEPLGPVGIIRRISLPASSGAAGFGRGSASVGAPDWLRLTRLAPVGAIGFVRGLLHSARSLLFCAIASSAHLAPASASLASVGAPAWLRSANDARVPSPASARVSKTEPGACEQLSSLRVPRGLGTIRSASLASVGAVGFVQYTTLAPLGESFVRRDRSVRRIWVRSVRTTLGSVGASHEPPRGRGCTPRGDTRSPAARLARGQNRPSSEMPKNRGVSPRDHHRVDDARYPRIRRNRPGASGRARLYIPWRSPVGAPVTSSSGHPHRFRQLALGEFAVLTPTVQFPIAPRSFQRRQHQNPLRRSAHPPVLATARDRPVVELLHPRARDP